MPLDRDALSLRLPIATGHLSVTELVYERLRHAILGGVFHQGERLRQTELAAALGVSPIPVREALAHLSHEGLVVLRAQHGAAVATVRAREVTEVYDVLRLLLGEVGASATTALDAAAIAQLKEFAAEMNRASAAQDAQRWSAAHTAFHAHINGATPNRHLRELADGYVRRANAFYALAGLPFPAQTGGDSHIALVSALSSRDLAAVRRLLEEHLLAARDRLLCHLEQAQPGAPEVSDPAVIAASGDDAS